MDANDRPRVSILFPAQHADAAAALGRAFVDDPLTVAIVRGVADPAARARRLAGLFRVVLAEHRHGGQPVLGVIDNGRVGAAAIVEQVAHPSSSASVVLRGLTLIPELVRAAGFSGLVRAISAQDTLLRNRPPEPHIYLNVLGVDPACQRRHFGGAILDFLRDQAATRPDLAGVYLETATAANVAYYTRFGYRVLNEFHPLGVPMWRMLQPAR